MCFARGSCCFLPGLQFTIGGQRGCWYQSLLQWKPPPPSSCDLHGVTVSVQQAEAKWWAFLYKMKTQHMHTLNKLTHAVSHVHLLHCNPSYFPFSQYSQGKHCVGCQPQQPCRLSVWTLLQSRGRQWLRLLVSTPHWLPVVPPPCCRKRLHYSWCNSPDCLHGFVPECLSNFIMNYYPNSQIYFGEYNGSITDPKQNKTKKGSKL